MPACCPLPLTLPASIGIPSPTILPAFASELYISIPAAKVKMSKFQWRIVRVAYSIN
jgi:hypothetical protein